MRELCSVAIDSNNEQQEQSQIVSGNISGGCDPSVDTPSSSIEHVVGGLYLYLI